jgi:hypothetical protein
MRRKANRRHMTGDRDGQAVEKATLLVIAVDGVLGPHRLLDGAGPDRRPADSGWVLATAAEDGVLRARYCISCPGAPGPVAGSDAP